MMTETEFAISSSDSSVFAEADDPYSPTSSLYEASLWYPTENDISLSWWDYDYSEMSEGFEDDMCADYTEIMDYAPDSDPQSHMNAAGRCVSHPFGDLRSAARARRRHRKIRENKGGCNSWKCRKEGQAEQRTQNKKKKRETVRFAVQESQRYVPCYTLDHFKESRHGFLEWDIRLPEEFDEYVTNMNDDVIRYAVLHHNADMFESSEPYVEAGETFTMWCQRRIAEMRGVKESRIQRGAPTHLKPDVWKTLKTFSSHGDEYDIYIGDPSTTTLSTNAYDALGHALLRSVLTPNKWWLKHCRRTGTPLLRAIEGYAWFGEYEWMWHRNMSGCWEIGYGGNCMDHDEDWGKTPIPCPHCCAGSGSMYYGCYCSDFRDERGIWSTPAPEEGQRCSLVEWVGKKGREIILEEAMEEMGKHGSDMDVKAFEVDMESGWELLSNMSSETWSVVDAE